MLKETRNTYKDSQVIIDGKEFVNCRFINCTLIMSTGETSMVGCEISNTTLSIVEGTPAFGAVELYKLFAEQGKPQSTKRW